MKFGELKPGEFFRFDGAVFVKHRTRSLVGAYVVISSEARWHVVGKELCLRPDDNVTPLDVHFTASEPAPSEALRANLERASAEVALWPENVRKAVSTEGVFTPAPSEEQARRES